MLNERDWSARVNRVTARVLLVFLLSNSIACDADKVLMFKSVSRKHNVCRGDIVLPFFIESHSCYYDQLQSTVDVRPTTEDATPSKMVQASIKVNWLTADSIEDADKFLVLSSHVAILKMN